MTFKVRKVSDWGYEETIEIDTLEALMDYATGTGHWVIIEDDSTLLIVDGYID